MLGPRFIGRYKVIEEIGRGGMGIVYRGEDPRLERAVAIKVLPPKKTSSAKALERFKREARVCARLDHPYILKIYDYGEEEQTYHLVMEYVEGVTLREVIGDDTDPGDIDVPEMARLFGQICQALEYAHALQITHRDIKPENIMVTTFTPALGTSRARVKVMDFGLAVLADRHDLTMTGAVMGTIAYLSPEQANGERADHRSDIYSLGAMFYEMLTGLLPFEAQSAAEMLRKHVDTPAPSPRSVNPRVHPVLERIVLTCMRKDPNDRYQSVRHIREELEGYRASAQISADFFWGSGGIISGEERAASQTPPPRPEVPVARDAVRGETEVPGEPVIERRVRDHGPHARLHDEPNAPMRREAFPGPDMRIWRESDEVLPNEMAPPQEPTAYSAPDLAIPPLASPYTPGMPPEIASRLGPTRPRPAVTPPAPTAPAPGAGHELKAPPPPNETVADEPARPAARAESQTTRREGPPPVERGPAVPPSEGARPPTSGANPVASKEWMQQAAGPQADPWGRYQNVLSRLRRDEGAIAGSDEVLEIPQTVCKGCGAENPGDRKYCHDCGSLLTPSLYQVAREAAAHNDQGLRFLRQGQYQDAVFEFQQALLLDAEMAEAHKNLGRVWAQLGDLVKAEEELRLAVSLGKDDAEPYLELAHLYRQAGRKGDAMQALADALRIHPEDASVRCQLAFLYSHTGNFVRAVEEYRTVLAYDVENLEAHLQLGIIYASQGMIAEAIAEMEWAVRLDPQNHRAYQWLGQLYVKRQRFGEAERAYQNALSINPTDADVHAELGSLYEIQRREDQALKQLRQAITLDQGHLDAHARLASLYLKYNQPVMAIKQLEEALAFHPQETGLHQQLGELYLAQNQLDRALLHFERTVELDPTSAELHSRLGQLYLKKDYGSLSISEYQKALSLDPYNAAYHEDLGMAYYVGGQRDGAIQELKKAAILNSRQVDYPKALGVICEEEGRLEEAVQYLKRALELNPRDADSHGLLGRIYNGQKMINLAVLEYQKALEYNPENQLMYIYLARAYAELGRPDVAINYFKQAINLIGGRGETPEARRVLARSYQELARTHLENGDTHTAYEILESAMALTPDDPRGMHYMGLVLQAQGELKKALDCMTEALRREPQNLDILTDLAGLFEARGERDLALRTIRKALMLNPSRPQLYEVLATILASQGSYDEASEALRKALSLDPKRAAHYHWLQGNFLLEQGRYQKAAGEYQHALSINAWEWRYYQGLARAFEELGRYEDAAAELEKALSLRLSERDSRRLREDLDRIRSIRR